MQIKTKNVSGPTANSKPVKQEVSGTVILPTLVFPALLYRLKVLSRRFQTTENLSEDFTENVVGEETTEKKGVKLY